MSSTSTVLDKDLCILDSNKKKLTLSCVNSTLVLDETGRRKVECPFRQVLWAETTQDGAFSLSLLHRQRNGFTLRRITGTIDASSNYAAASWVESLMDSAYKGQRNRRFKVMINPRGGPGRARSIFEKKVKPIFEAANCSLDVMITEYNKHCYEYCKTMSLDYDAVVLLSGDGLVHEVFNGFAEREDAVDAFEIPVVQIPTGSANGLSLCLLGLKDGYDVSAATLNAIKGTRMKLDLCSIKQEGKRLISFMSQAMGLMADVDLGTENLRWMGDARFMMGFLREVVANRRCPVKLEIQVAAKDKKEMIQTYRASRSYGDFNTLSIPESSKVQQSLRSAQSDVDLYHRERSESGLASTEYSEDIEGWTTIDKPLAYVYAGKLPYVSRDFMQFPVALSDDGFIDIVAQEHCSRTTLLKAMDGAAQGKQYWVSTQHYFKAKAYRVTPLTKKGNLAFDGEKYPFEPFQVEVHPRMGTTLGGGSWHSNF